VSSSDASELIVRVRDLLIMSFAEISAMSDWYFTQDTLKAAAIDLVNYGFGLPITKNFGTGDTCSADGMRFYSRQISCAPITARS
jgi:TnpA family transposase